MIRVFKLLCLTSLLIGTPFVGIVLTGCPVEPYLAFPPTTKPAEPTSFSWWIFGGLFLLEAAVLFPFIRRFLEFSKSRKKKVTSTRPFPWWGWAGLGSLILSWTLAWSRFAWFQPLQNHTFTPLWIGYILTINALTVKRTGHCLLTGRPHFYLSLFPLSAGFWWIFEFLNRFVHNWYYQGGIELDAASYFWLGTISFSTVLPAVVGTNEYLGSFPRLRLAFHSWRMTPIRGGRALGGTIIALSAAGLMGIGLWPNLLYPLLWLSPLMMVVGLQRMWGEKSVLEAISEGNWCSVVLPALSGLVCGFLWEMWNFYSEAHWIYVIPYVHGFQLFEMPLLGYFGYFPFGICCLALVQFLLDNSTTTPFFITVEPGFKLSNIFS